MRPRFDRARIVALTARMSIAAAAREIGCRPATIKNALREMRAPTEGRRTSSRFAHPSLSGAAATMPAYDHPAIMEGRTMYPASVRHESVSAILLKSGHNSSKIGRVILKGAWKGFPVYTLTLEERATCPKSCRHWRSCYGSGMPFAERFLPGAALEQRIERELAILALKHRAGFAVRLHVLGDFYSVAYVGVWRAALAAHRNLHVFGFTARWRGASDPIAAALIDLVDAHWPRFAIRFSDAPAERFSTVTIEHPFQKPPDAIICPAQMGKTESCSQCCLCWHTDRRIAFIQH